MILPETAAEKYLREYHMHACTKWRPNITVILSLTFPHENLVIYLRIRNNITGQLARDISYFYITVIYYVFNYKRITIFSAETITVRCDATSIGMPGTGPRKPCTPHLDAPNIRINVHGQMRVLGSARQQGTAALFPLLSLTVRRTH